MQKQTDAKSLYLIISKALFIYLLLPMESLSPVFNLVTPAVEVFPAITFGANTFPSFNYYYYYFLTFGEIDCAKGSPDLFWNNLLLLSNIDDDSPPNFATPSNDILPISPAPPVKY